MDTSSSHVLLVFPALRIRLYRANLTPTATSTSTEAFTLLRDLHIASPTGSIVAAALTVPPHAPAASLDGAAASAEPVATARRPQGRAPSGRRSSRLGHTWSDTPDNVLTPRGRLARESTASLGANSGIIFEDMQPTGSSGTLEGGQD